MPGRVAAEAIARCDPALGVLTLAGEALGTSWRVRLVDRGVSTERLHAAIEARLAAIVAEMSQWDAGSRLSAFNRAPPGTWFALPPDFAHVVAAGLDLAARTGGAFDPTLGRVAALLGYGAETVAGPPSAAELGDALAHTGWRRLDFDRAARRLRQPGGAWLDLSAIAKGFAVDAVADLLRDQSVPDALVEIGGELAGRGLKPDGQPWWVDLESPPGAPVPPLRLALHDAAVATSGDYVRGAHTLDRRTAHAPAYHVTSVTVIAGRAMDADAWATALTVLGPIAGAQTAAREGLPARIVWREDGRPREHLSPALRAMIDD